MAARRTAIPHEGLDAGVVALGAEYGADVCVYGAVAEGVLVGMGRGERGCRGNGVGRD